VAAGAGSAYLGAMPLPRPSSPKALIADLKAFASQRSPHHWIAAALAILMPLALVALFIKDGKTNIAPGPQLIYAESWSSNRTDEEIKADQVKHQAEREAKQKERQRQFKELEKGMEKLGI
jgi:hypothetical protein